MGFIRQQEEKLAVRFLSWQYEKLKKPLPPEVELELQAAKIVAEAHDLARARGRINHPLASADPIRETRPRTLATQGNTRMQATRLHLLLALVSMVGIVSAAEPADAYRSFCESQEGLRPGLLGSWTYVKKTMGMAGSWLARASRRA